MADDRWMCALTNTAVGGRWSLYNGMGQLISTGLTLAGTTSVQGDVPGTYIMSIDGPGIGRVWKIVVAPTG